MRSPVLALLLALLLGHAAHASHALDAAREHYAALVAGAHPHGAGGRPCRLPQWAGAVTRAPAGLPGLGRRVARLDASTAPRRDQSRRTNHAHPVLDDPRARPRDRPSRL